MGPRKCFEFPENISTGKKDDKCKKLHKRRNSVMTLEMQLYKCIHLNIAI
jgi:hypothetical protein